MNDEQRERRSAHAAKWGMSLEALQCAVRLVKAMQKFNIIHWVPQENWRAFHEFRMRGRSWVESGGGQGFLEGMNQHFKPLLAEYRQKLERDVASLADAELIELRGKGFRIYHPYPVVYWQVMGALEVQFLLMFAFCVYYRSAAQAAWIHLATCEVVDVLTSEIFKRAVDDPYIRSLLLLHAGSESEAESTESCETLRRILNRSTSGLVDLTGDSDTLQDLKAEVFHEYVFLKELSPERWKGREQDEFLQEAFAGKVASPRGFRCDVVNMLRKKFRRRELVSLADPLDLKAIREAGSRERDKAQVEDSLIDKLTLKETGELLERREEAIGKMLGRNAPAILRERYEKPWLTQEEVAQNLGCGLRTVERVLEKARDNRPKLIRMFTRT
jgi:hypothetical protein